MTIPACHYCDRPPASVIGDWIGCTRNAIPGSRDAECSICMSSFEHGEELIMHDGCRHVWHLSCMDQVVLTTLETAIGPTDATCPMCRQPVKHLALHEYRIQILTTAPDNVVEHLKAADPGPVYPAYRDHLEAVVDARGHLYPEASQFFQRHIMPDDTGEFPSYQLPPGQREPGSEAFREQMLVMGGALVLLHCDHRWEYFLMQAEKFYKTVRDLSLWGWDPAWGRRISRVTPRRPPVWLRDLIEDCKNTPTIVAGETARDVSFRQFAELFPHSVMLSWGVKVFLRVFNPQGQPNKWNVRVVVFVVDDAGRIDICGPDMTRRLVRELGGVGAQDNLIVQHDDAMRANIQLMWDRWDALMVDFHEGDDEANAG